MKEISSVSNELIVNFKKLKLKKYRKEQGVYLLEGRRLVTDALTAGAQYNRGFKRDAGARRHYGRFKNSYSAI